jgi:hypothetical protein
VAYFHLCLSVAVLPSLKQNLMHPLFLKNLMLCGEMQIVEGTTHNLISQGVTSEWCKLLLQNEQQMTQHILLYFYLVEQLCPNCSHKILQSAWKLTEHVIRTYIHKFIISLIHCPNQTGYWTRQIKCTVFFSQMPCLLCTYVHFLVPHPTKPRSMESIQSVSLSRHSMVEIISFYLI